MARASSWIIDELVDKYVVVIYLIVGNYWVATIYDLYWYILFVFDTIAKGYIARFNTIILT